MLGFKSIFVSWKCHSSFLASQVKKLIVQDPKKRLTTQQALQHPWVTGKAVNFTHMDTAQKKLLEFNARRKLKVWGFWLNYTFSSRFYPSKPTVLYLIPKYPKASKCLAWWSSALSMCPSSVCYSGPTCLFCCEIVTELYYVHVRIHFILLVIFQDEHLRCLDYSYIIFFFFMIKLQSVTFFVLQNVFNWQVQSIFQIVFLACPESLRYTYNKSLYSDYFRLIRVGYRCGVAQYLRD